jgi:hypothetical protein
MSQQSPYICNFYFIPNADDNILDYKLVYEYGKQSLSIQSVILHFTSAFYSLISALEFLESINLYYPKVELSNLVYCTNDSPNQLDGSYKLINQFCFDDYFDFIVNVYLNPDIPQRQINQQIKRKKFINLNELKMIVKEILVIHPRIYDPSHQLSNILVFDKYLERLDAQDFAFMDILNKFKELFNINKNCNIGYSSSVSYQNNQSSYFHSGNKHQYLNSNKPGAQVLGTYYHLFYAKIIILIERSE